MGLEYNDVALYVEGAALTTRMYASPGATLAVNDVAGSLTMDRAGLATGLRDAV